MSSENVTSGLRLSAWYTSARNVVISNRSPSYSAPTVPNRSPWIQTASAQPFTVRSIDVRPGVGRDVDVRARAVAVEERVAHAAADEVRPVPRVREPARELLRRRLRLEVAREPRRDRRHPGIVTQRTGNAAMELR